MVRKEVKGGGRNMRGQGLGMPQLEYGTWGVGV